MERKILVLAFLLIIGFSPASAIDGQSADFNFGGKEYSGGFASGAELTEITLININNLNPNISSDGIISNSGGKKPKTPRIVGATFYLPNEFCKVGEYKLKVLGEQISTSQDCNSQSAEIELPDKSCAYISLTDSKSKSNKRVVKSKGLVSVSGNKPGTLTITSVEKSGITKTIKGTYQIDDIKASKFNSKVKIPKSVSDIKDCKDLGKTKVSKKSKTTSSSGSFEALVITGLGGTGDSGSGLPEIPDLPF